MTIPAHDSVAYLPARPRLALLRKEADQLILCLPCPTLRPKDQWDLCFGGRAAARLPAWRIGARQTRVPFEDWMGLAFDACRVALAWPEGLRVHTSETTSDTSHSRDSASGETVARASRC